MGDKAVEPSEIFINREGIPKETISHIQPQIRLLARFFDYSLFFVILGSIRFFSASSFPTHLFQYAIPLEFFAWIPIEAILLSTWGTTPGKFLLRTVMRQGRRPKLDFQTAMRRSFQVWFRGMGMGIPGVNILCMIVAGHKLRLLGSTSWDRESNILISHFPVRQSRMIFASLFIFATFVWYYVGKYGK